jgi:hypothetical protein
LSIAFCLPFQVLFSVAVTNLFVVVLSPISSALSVTTHVFPFTLVTSHVGVGNNFQLDATLYGSAYNIYVFNSLGQIATSHFSAALNDVSSLELLIVNVSVIATAGTTDVFNFQLLSNTGTLPAEVQVSLVAAVHKLLDTPYTCASVAGLVQSFVAVVVLLGNTGSDPNVLTPLTV